ncbi:hypothetical protein ACRRQX_001828 [Yersinia enterocolitica]|uniref:hypothetical protein n=1 Tax=Yersinia TaxID=629 RepID=UPI000519B283|nr:MULTISPECIES: hypothetical protein [Yersinia]AKF36206.1 hypothetical protein FORC2_0059 [Yersinia enterocolitica]ALG47193.1 hypothetical protein LI89_21445 [Yersinia enterocolitica]EKN3990507.1 hypothetical protein [Yersinia enterocolitica]EKN5946915.1 hypothetical protein [Yersinia enterocolitica]ELW7381210.1 hypothetical protein [Yersinia enterocolitica]
MKENFISAIHNRQKIRLIFFSKEDNCLITRLTAPMDFGPSRRSHNKSERYHFWDYESDQKNHVLSLLPESIHSIDILDSIFSPSEFISWKTNWFIERDWGEYS